MPAGDQPRYADLGRRLISSVVLAALALWCIWLGGAWVRYLAGTAALLMMVEWSMITRRSRALVPPVILPALLVWMVPHLLGLPVDIWGPLALMAAGLILAFETALPSGRGVAAGLWAVAGCALIATVAGSFVALRAVEPFGFLSIVWAALVVVSADVGGYFAGRSIGGPKLWPRVSPKKTWAGLGGGVVLAFFVGGLFSWATTGTYFYQVCVVSMVAAVVAQGGDLAESALKRHFGVKDASSLIPGHGGALDRLDGHMAAILVATLVTFWRGAPVFVW